MSTHPRTPTFFPKMKHRARNRRTAAKSRPAIGTATILIHVDIRPSFARIASAPTHIAATLGNVGNAANSAAMAINLLPAGPAEPQDFKVGQHWGAALSGRGRIL